MTRQHSFVLGIVVSCFVDPKALLLATLTIVLFGPQLFAFTDSGSASASTAAATATATSTTSTSSTATEKAAQSIFKQFINHHRVKELIELFQKKS